MQLAIGSYKFGVNQTELAVRQETLFSNVGQPYEQHITWNIKGYLLTTLTDPAQTYTASQYQNDLTQQENSLKNASVSYQNVTFAQDSGTISSEQLPTQLAITGNRILRVAFPRTTGPEYATERYFEIDLEAYLPIINLGLVALEFKERLQFGGGYPLYVHKLAVNGLPPQKQLVYRYTPYTCTQSGVIVGYKTYISPPPQKFPTALMHSPTASASSPTRRGPGIAAYTSFEQTYEYYFESATPLVAAPAVWSGNGYI